MNYLEFIILGVVQGITEFLPISSSGHLLIGRTIFSIESDVSSSFIEVILHGGTLLAILLFWKKDILDDIKDTLRNKSKFYLFVFVATVPAAIFGLLFKDFINHYFFNINNIQYLFFSYLFLACVLILTKNKRSEKYNNISFYFALLIGLSQSLAIIPGISRSGITIACALLLGLNSKIATKFSFMLAIPILFFSFVDSIFNNYSLINNSTMLVPLFFGFLSSFIVGCGGHPGSSVPRRRVDGARNRKGR